jgi:hypothetical protein
MLVGSYVCVVSDKVEFDGNVSLSCMKMKVEEETSDSLCDHVQTFIRFLNEHSRSPQSFLTSEIKDDIHARCIHVILGRSRP